MSNIVNQCRRLCLRKLSQTGEDIKDMVKHPNCCDVCELTAESTEADHDLTEELEILYIMMQYKH